MKLKEKLIHILGGMTAQDISKSNEMIAKNAFLQGQIHALHDVQVQADRLYGCSADEWCQQVCSHIEKRLEGLKHKYCGDASENKD